MLFSKADLSIFQTKVVVPEQVLYNCYAKMLDPVSQDKVLFSEKKLESGKAMTDDVFSDYPSLVVGNKVINKNNIGIFLKKVTNINDKFRQLKDSVARLEKIKRLEVLCQT